MENNIEKKSSKQIKYGALISYFAIFINIIFGLLYTPWILKQIGDSDYGLYTLASSFVSLFMLDFGMSSAVTRFISKYRALNQKEKINEFLGVIYKLYLLIVAVISVILIVVYFYIDVIYNDFTAAEIEKFKLIFIIISLTSVISFPFITLNGILTSYEQFVSVKTCDLLNKVGTVIVTVIVLLNGGGLYELVAINVFLNLLTVCAKFIVVKIKIPVKVNWKTKDKGVFSSIFNFSMWITITSLAQRLIFNTMPTIIAFAGLNSASVTQFGLSSTIEGYVFTFSQAINGMFFSKISRISVSENKRDGLMHLMIKVGRINLYIVGLIVLGFVVLGNDFIRLWLNSDNYSAIYYSVILMILPNIISYPQQIADTTLVVENKVKIRTLIIGLTSVMNMFVSYILIRKFGIIGAALSIFLVYNIRTFAMNCIYHKMLQINLLKFFKECHLKLLPGFVLTAVLSCILKRYFSVKNWISFLLFVGVILIIYGLSMLLLCFNTEEKKLFKLKK